MLLSFRLDVLLSPLEVYLGINSHIIVCELIRVFTEELRDCNPGMQADQGLPSAYRGTWSVSLVTLYARATASVDSGKNSKNSKNSEKF